MYPRPRMTYELVALLLLLTLAPAWTQTAPHGYFTSSDGLTIHYLHRGSGKGDPVILIPGYGQWAFYWFRATGLGWALGGEYRVFAMDLRGHGQSDKPHDPLQYGPQMAQDVIDLMDHLGIEKAHVHGFGLGGALLTRLLIRHQDRLITAIYGGSGVPEVAPKWASLVPTDLRVHDPRERWHFNSVVSGAISDDKALNALYQYPWDAGTGFEGYVRSAASEIDLKQVRIPVLAIVGEYDSPNRWTHRMARELAHFEKVVLPKRGHLRSVESSTYNQVAARFIRRHRSQQR